MGQASNALTHVMWRVSDVPQPCWYVESWALRGGAQHQRITHCELAYSVSTARLVAGKGAQAGQPLHPRGLTSSLTSALALECLRGQACLDDQLHGGLQVHVLLVVLLHDVLRGLEVLPDGGGLPAPVVAAGVAVVQLEPPVLVPARNMKLVSIPYIA